MDHVVYLDTKANELEKLLNGTKKMIIRGATGRKLPYGKVFEGDHLFFINNNGEGEIKAFGKVSNVFNSDKMTEEESKNLIMKYEKELELSEAQIKRWGGKRYLVLISVADIKPIKPFEIDKSNYGNMDDWLPVEDINKVKM